MIAVINFGSSKTPLISQALNEFGFANKIIHADDFTNIISKYFKGIILSGSPTLLTKEDLQPYLNKYSFIKEVKIPVLGICFGHQLLGVLFGSKVYLGKPIRKETEIAILKNNALFKELPGLLTMMEDHTEGIDLPNNFELLASSSDYINEGMKHKSKNIYGVQFHPEVSDEAGKKLLYNFCTKVCEL